MIKMLKTGLMLSLLLLLAIPGSSVSQIKPSPIKMSFSATATPAFQSGFQRVPGLNGWVQPGMNAWKIAPPSIRWQAGSRWRSIQEIYILKHRVFNEIIRNEKRLNLA